MPFILAAPCDETITLESRLSSFPFFERRAYNGPMKRTLGILLLLVLSPIPANGSGVPGVIVDHSPAISGIYLGSPGIVILPNGDYLAKSDEFGPGSTMEEEGVTRIYRSRDRGMSWSREEDIPGLFWASIFKLRDATYLMGTTCRYGNLVILRSIDAGHTWTKPQDRRTGMLFSEGYYHCAPVPVVVHNGRIWRAMEDAMGSGGWGHRFRTFMMSARIDTDLLDAENWISSNRLSRVPEWLGGRFGGWLEGNAVVSPTGEVTNILRVDFRPEGGKGAIVRVSADGRNSSFNPKDDFIDFPGGCKKFTIRFDPASRCYWALTNYIPSSQRSDNPERTRNTVALIASTDLSDWEVRCILLHHPDREKHGFQYLDWQFEADDIVALSRTAYDDASGGPHNQHDANFITFHRVRGFRELGMEDSVLEP